MNTRATKQRKGVLNRVLNVDSQQFYWAFACFVMLGILYVTDHYLRANDISAPIVAKEPEVSLDKSSVIPMKLATIALPEVPPLAQTTTSLQATMAAQAFSTGESPVPHKQRLPISSETVKGIHINHKHSTSNLSSARLGRATTEQYGAAEKTSQRDVSDVMQALSGADLQIAMPASLRAREQVLDFLYQCAGVGLAAVDKQFEEARLMPLTALPEPASSVLRSISGQMNSYEHQLKAAYAPRLSLVRVYPMIFDVVLSTEIARNLNGQALTHFFAEYQLHQHSLSVINIRLNRRPLGQTWLLFDGYKQRCGL